VDQLAQTIQIALAPVFLLVAMGSLLNVITGRLARVVDRSRQLIERYSETEGDEHVQLVRELRIIDRRMTIINWSMALCVACGIVVCIMVAMLFLMGSGQQALTTPIAATFIIAMLLLLVALVLFMLEVRLAIRTIHVPGTLLER
jgi:hypothetical protein